MSETNPDKEVVLDTTLLHKGLVHKLIQNGGSIKFKNFPFGMRVEANNDNWVVIKLFSIPSGVKYNPKINDSAKQEEKKKQPKIEVEEEGEMEL